jgi:hypothetical protein
MAVGGGICHAFLSAGFASWLAFYASSARIRFVVCGLENLVAHFFAVLLW